MLFDKCDRRLITGGDDGIVKIWCVRTGLLLYSLRAHNNCISDLSIDASNSFLAVGALDGYISFWSLQTGKHLFTINAFSPILTLEIQPTDIPHRKALMMATCSDGYAKFWAVDFQAHSATPTPIKHHCKLSARDGIRCASFSPAGFRFVVGATDGIVRLFKSPTLDDFGSSQPTKLTPPHAYRLEDHIGYVNSVYFCSTGTRFVSSSWDGCVREWSFDKEGGNWTSVAYDTALAVRPVGGRPRKVTIVTYCRGDSEIVCGVNKTHEIVCFTVGKSSPSNVLRYHTDEVYILSPHPLDDHILLSAGCDGRIALWNMKTHSMIFKYHALNTRFYDGCFNQDGSMFSLVDDLGRMTIFGCGVSSAAYDIAPASQFFPTDWNELIFDSQRNAIDAVTQLPTDAVPRDKLVSIEKVEYPPIVKPDYAGTITTDCDKVILGNNQRIFREQFDEEQRLFNIEQKTHLDRLNDPRRVPRSHMRVLGSEDEDGEQQDEEDIVPEAALLGPDMESDDELFQARESETDEEISITSEEDGEGEENVSDEEGAITPSSHYNLRRRMTETLSRPTRHVITELEGDDELYRPSSLVSQARVPPRRRPVIAEESSSTTDEQVLRTPSKWVTVKRRTLFPYLPQLYDVVVYLPEGHAKFLEVEKRHEFNQDLPWERGPIDDVVFGQIVSLGFHVGPPVYCELELVTIDRKQTAEIMLPITQHGAHYRRIHICYYDLEGHADFIVPFCLYKWSVSEENILRPKELVKVVFSEDEVYDARIKKLNVPANLIADRPWQCYQVEWLQLQDQPENLNPWEVEAAQNCKSDNSRRTAYECQERMDDGVVAMLIDGLGRIMRGPTASAFRRPVDWCFFTDYLENVAYPMDLSLLLARLKNGYYRRLESFEWECKLIYENAFRYNKPDSEIVREAESLNQAMLRLLKRVDRSTRRHLQRRTPLPPPNVNLAATPTRRGESAREARARRRATLDLRDSSHRDSSPIRPAESPGRQLRGRVVPLVTERVLTSSPLVPRKRTRCIYQVEKSSEMSSASDFSPPLGDEKDHFETPSRLCKRPVFNSPRSTQQRTQRLYTDQDGASTSSRHRYGPSRIS